VINLLLDKTKTDRSTA